MMWRRARASDDEAIVRMSVSLYEEDPGSRSIARKDVECTLETFRREPGRGCCVVLEREGVVVGYAFLVAFWSNEYGGEICTIDELFVDTSQRGRGLATDLILALAQKSDLFMTSAVALALEVTPNNARARSLYERLGFSAKNILMRKTLA